MRLVTFSLFLFVPLLIAATADNVAGAQETSDEPPSPLEEVMFDTDRNLILKDSDGDGVPDLTENIEGTDPFDRSSFQGADIGQIEANVSGDPEAVGFPTANCRAGYRQAGPRLCISTNVQNATRYAWAQRRCRVNRGRMASYEDLYYVYIHSALDASYNPDRRWIGNMVADDKALCGNRQITFNGDPDRNNFEGTCNKNDIRGYWCAHDRVDGNAGPPRVTYNLQFRRFTTTPLTNADADRILRDASRVIQTDDGANDVACDVGFTRNGPVTTFSTGDGSIDSNAEFTAVNGLPGQIKAVNQINWCGGIAPNIIGCAPVPGQSLVFVPFNASLEGILLLHEFGHNKGLSHRNGTDNVMHPSIGATRLGVNQAECNAFRVAPSLVAASAPTVMADGSEIEAEVPVESPGDVRDFVRQYFVHGTSFAVASSYGPKAIPILLGMLKDPAETEWWPNIVATLGMIGEEEVVEPLIEFLEADAGDELARSHYVAKSVVPMALGYALNRSGSERALGYLIAAADPAFWSDTDVGRAEFQANTQQRDFDLTTKATLGLALSGDPRARVALREMQTDNRPSLMSFQAQVGDLIEEALRENEAIERQGLEQYYLDRQQNQR